MWSTLLSKLAGTLPDSVIGYYKEKRKLKNALKLAKLDGKIAIQKAADERKAAQQHHIQTWEMSYVNQQRESIKDEIVLAVFLWPFVGVFIPGVQDYVLLGFDYLAKVPYWWVGLVVSISLAIYGIRHRQASKIQAPGLRTSDTRVEISPRSVIPHE